MPSKTLAVFLVIIPVIFGGIAGEHLYADKNLVLVLSGIGLLVGLVCLQVLRVCLRAEPYKVIGGVAGTLAGCCLGFLISIPLTAMVESLFLSSAVFVFAMAVTGIMGLQLGAAKVWEVKKKGEKRPESSRKIMGILDTSVIIDGRIADVCETGFLIGDLIIPQFVLKELQMIADSADSQRRTRGRRGLDVLNKIQKQPYVSIIIADTDYPLVKEVDQKLISMAKETGHSILTNDFNLNKVAEVHSIQVLNINQLANALKPIVLPGENMRVQVMKEGKEHGQGVAYLDDGTMVVIENGRRFMGRNVDVTVTSVLQTTAGRMIFAAVKG
jgi:uncharacterized protein YacL